MTWTAPGDNGHEGIAAAYDIRYATSPITNGAQWAQAPQAANEPAPVAAGGTQTFIVDGLSAGTNYYLCLKTVDESSNWSDLSNCVSMSTVSTGFYPIIGGPLQTYLYFDLRGLVSAWRVDTNGRLLENLYVAASDGLVIFEIPAGSEVLDSSGQPLRRITVSSVEAIPEPPSGFSVLYAVDFEPYASVLNPGMKVMIHYTPDVLSSGTYEAGLQAAIFDQHRNEWVFVDSVVDVDVNSIALTISQLSILVLLILSPDEKPAPTVNPSPSATDEPKPSAKPIVQPTPSVTPGSPPHLPPIDLRDSGGVKTNPSESISPSASSAIWGIVLGLIIGVLVLLPLLLTWIHRRAHPPL